jgi:pyruvate/2-oxoglutarate dehydrogenase complex dihydrolipoamide acyltransferase (E2) component
MALLQEIQVPLLAVNDTVLAVAELSFATGAKVKKGDVVMILETSKTTYDVEAEAEGYIQYLCETGKDYEVNTPVARIYSEAAEAETAAPPRPAANAGPAATANPGLAAVAAGRRQSPVTQPATLRAGQLPASTRVWEGETLFSREATRLMGTAGIEKLDFAGKDFVTGADVRDFLTRNMHPAPPVKTETTGMAPAGHSSAPRPAPGILPVDPVKAVVEKLASAKRREIEYLSEVQSTGLTSTVNTYVDTEGIFTFINRGLRYLKDSLLPVIIYEVGRLLTDYSPLNGYFTGEAAALYKEINPGFAIDIDKGLKVLKIADAGQKSIGDIEAEILQLSGQYLDDTLRIDQLTDITFTITDLSSEGVAFFRPLINKMNSAILGVSAIDERLQRCTLSLTFDHRMTEGRLAARFLQELKGRLESYRPKELPGREDISCFKCFKTLKEDLGGTGFVHCITPEGKDGYICQSCLKGF